MLADKRLPRQSMRVDVSGGMIINTNSAINSFSG